MEFCATTTTRSSWSPWPGEIGRRFESSTSGTPVWSIASRVGVGNEEDARDITHDVFVAVAQSARRYKPEARVTTWIYRIVVNRCLNHRARASRRLHADMLQPMAVGAIGGLLLEIPVALFLMPCLYLLATRGRK